MSSSKGAPTTSEVREWASKKGLPVGRRGRLSGSVITAWNKSHSRKYGA
jgi:hypothetical protein